MPSLSEAIRDARRRMEDGEQPYQERMQRLYGHVIRNLESDMQLLGMQIEQARIAGEDVHPDWLRRQARYHRLLDDAEREFNRFAQQGEGVVQDAQIQAIRGGALEAWELMDASGVTTGYTGGRVNTIAVENTVSAVTSAPISRILASYGPTAQQTIADTLLDGIARGRGARAIIRDIKRDLVDVNATRLEALVRTESARAFRASMATQYQRMEHLGEGYRWTAAKSARTCLSCLARDGQITPKPPTQQHVNCRCTFHLVPKGSTYTYVKGEQWFARQSEDVQRRMMPSEEAFTAYRDGRITLMSFSGEHRSPVWGTTYYQRSGRQALEAA